jgi:hypothetical protein
MTQELEGAAGATSPRPSLTEHVQRAVEGTRLLQEDNSRLREDLDRANASLAMEQTKNEQLAGHLAKCEALRDHYMRRAVELEVVLTTLQCLVMEAVTNGKAGEFRGSGQRQKTKLEELAISSSPPPLTADSRALSSLVAKIGQGAGQLKP